MTLEQIETLQRVAGILEAVATVSKDKRIEELLVQCVEMLDSVLAKPTTMENPRST